MKIPAEAHWYREEDSTVCCAPGRIHKVTKGHVIQSVVIGPYFYDFCYRHAPFKNLPHKIAFLSRTRIKKEQSE